MTTSTMLIFAAFIGILVWFMSRMRLDPARLAATQAAISRGAVIVDVRSPAEFRAGHIAGAKNLPLPSLGGRLSEVGGTDREVVVYCASGARSSSAVQKFRAAGYGSVIDAGAMRNLSAAQRATVAPEEPTLNRQQRRQQQRQTRRGR